MGGDGLPGRNDGESVGCGGRGLNEDSHALQYSLIDVKDDGRSEWA